MILRRDFRYALQNCKRMKQSSIPQNQRASETRNSITFREGQYSLVEDAKRYNADSSACSSPLAIAYTEQQRKKKSLQRTLSEISDDCTVYYAQAQSVEHGHTCAHGNSYRKAIRKETIYSRNNYGVSPGTSTPTTKV